MVSRTPGRRGFRRRDPARRRRQVQKNKLDEQFAGHMMPRLERPRAIHIQESSMAVPANLLRRELDGPMSAMTRAVCQLFAWRESAMGRERAVDIRLTRRQLTPWGPEGALARWRRPGIPRRDGWRPGVPVASASGKRGLPRCHHDQRLTTVPACRNRIAVSTGRSKLRATSRTAASSEGAAQPL